MWNVHMDVQMDVHWDVQNHVCPGDNPNPPLGSTPLFGDPDTFTVIFFGHVAELWGWAVGDPPLGEIADEELRLHI